MGAGALGVSKDHGILFPQLRVQLDEHMEGETEPGQTLVIPSVTASSLLKAVDLGTLVGQFHGFYYSCHNALLGIEPRTSLPGKHSSYH